MGMGKRIGGTAKRAFCTEIAAGTIILDFAANVVIHLWEVWNQ